MQSSSVLSVDIAALGHPLEQLLRSSEESLDTARLQFGRLRRRNSPTAVRLQRGRAHLAAVESSRADGRRLEHWLEDGPWITAMPGDDLASSDAAVRA